MADKMKLAINDEKRVQRKFMITVVEYDGSKYGGTTKDREALGKRTPDSSIEFNNQVEKTKDIFGTNYTDVESTEPQQSFEPYYLLGGSPLGLYLSQAQLANDTEAYNNHFTAYIITGFLRSDGKGIDTSGKVRAYMHKNCTVEPQSLGGENYVEMPITVHFSNDIEIGTVSIDADGKIDVDEFKFTPDDISGNISAFGGAVDDTDGE